jgi:alpha-glucoside transport system substrate-binding protein
MGKAMSLHIQFLGQPSIRFDDSAVNLSSGRPLALLAYLLVTKKSHRREHLIDLLFDGPDDPRAALRWTLTKIRKAIGDEYIVSERGEISFNFESNFWLDVSAFEAGEIELFQGDLLEGLYLRHAIRFEEWLLFERQRIRGQYQAGMEKQLELHQRQGEYAAVVITAQQLLKLDNLREDWHRSLMEAYARLGKRTTALDQFELCRQALRTEWDMDPAPETLALAKAIQDGRISSQVSRMENGTSPPKASSSQKQAVEPVEAGEARPRTDFSSRNLALIGVLSLVVLLLIASIRFINQGQNTAGDESPIAGSGAQIESDPQALAGTEVSIIGNYNEDLLNLFNQSMVPLQERTGINVIFISDGDQFIAKSLRGEDMPDIVMLPQPGRLFELEKEGKIIDLKTFMDDDYLQQQYPEAYLDLATLDGKMLGVWFSVGLKSLVWYPSQAFKAKGYEVPETWDELMALSDQIVADGGTPWCIAINDFDGLRWVGTDWVEDILLRTAPPETYDAWVRHELPFNSPEIRRVFEIMGQIWLNEDYVYGGVANIPSEYYQDNPTHLFEDPPGCYLHKQASFAPLFFPPGVRYGEDYDFFYLPPIDPEFGKPVLGSGDIVAMLNDRPEVREVMRYFTTPESAKVMIEHGGFLNPHRGTPIEWFPTTADLRFAQIILSADSYRFDGSDLMPEEVGMDAFFRGIHAWVEGVDLDTVLQQIDDSWPF